MEEEALGWSLTDGHGRKQERQRGMPKESVARPGVAQETGSIFRWAGRATASNQMFCYLRRLTLTNGGSVGQRPCGLGSLPRRSFCFLPSPSWQVYGVVWCVCVRAPCQGSAIAEAEITSAMGEEECHTLPSPGPRGENPANQL